MFKHFNAIKIIFYIYIIFFIIKNTNQEETQTDSVSGITSKVIPGESGAIKCNYGNNNEDLDVYLNGTDAKQRCFDLSNNFNNPACCYYEDKDKKECVTKSDDMDSKYICPKDNFIPNNCGLAGIYQPESSTICTEITLVQGYCCYVGVKTGDETKYSCLRTKKLAKEKNKAPEQITSYVTKIDQKYVVESCICWNYYLQYFWFLNLIINIILLL